MSADSLTRRASEGETDRLTILRDGAASSGFTIDFLEALTSGLSDRAVLKVMGNARVMPAHMKSSDNPNLWRRSSAPLSVVALIEAHWQAVEDCATAEAALNFAQLVRADLQHGSPPSAERFAEIGGQTLRLEAAAVRAVKAKAVTWQHLCAAVPADMAEVRIRAAYLLEVDHIEGLAGFPAELGAVLRSLCDDATRDALMVHLQGKKA